MSDSHTEVTTKSWGSRLSESIKGVLVGLVLFIAAFPVLFINEGRSVKTAGDLASLGKEAIHVEASKVDPANDTKPVHMTGEAKTAETLTDEALNYSANAIHLSRSVEMYQWKEKKSSKTEKKVGGKEETVTTYSYEKGWSSTAIDSSQFKKPEGRRNPGAMPYEAKKLSAKEVTLGAFKLIPAQISRISAGEKVNFNAELIAKLPPELRGKAKASGEWLFIGRDPGSPQVGDVRIGLEMTKSPQTISIIAKQNNDTFQAYGGKEGTSQLLVTMGTVDKEGMIQSAQKANATKTWLIRLGGLVLMYLGLTMIFKPLVTVADVLPFLGSLLSMGLGLFSGIIAFTLSLITIAIAWVFYRPVLAIILLVIAAGLIAFGIMRAKKKKAAAAPA